MFDDEDHYKKSTISFGNKSCPQIKHGQNPNSFMFVGRKTQRCRGKGLINREPEPKTWGLLMHSLDSKYSVIRSRGHHCTLGPVAFGVIVCNFYIFSTKKIRNSKFENPPTLFLYYCTRMC